MSPLSTLPVLLAVLSFFKLATALSSSAGDFSPLHFGDSSSVLHFGHHYTHPHDRHAMRSLTRDQDSLLSTKLQVLLAYLEQRMYRRRFSGLPDYGNNGATPLGEGSSYLRDAGLNGERWLAAFARDGERPAAEGGATFYPATEDNRWFHEPVELSRRWDHVIGGEESYSNRERLTMRLRRLREIEDVVVVEREDVEEVLAADRQDRSWALELAERALFELEAELAHRKKRRCPYLKQLPPGGSGSSLGDVVPVVHSFLVRGCCPPAENGYGLGYSPKLAELPPEERGLDHVPAWDPAPEWLVRGDWSHSGTGSGSHSTSGRRETLSPVAARGAGQRTQSQPSQPVVGRSGGE